MDSRDLNTVSSSTHPGNHESHEVHLCHRCGWPFPNPHPSAKHRRAHNRICGTIEGYSVIHSQEDGHHFSASHDEHEHASDSDDVHTPSPMPVDKSDKEVPSSSVIGEKTKRSEEDEFSDAVTEFGDSGVSSQMERFYSFTGDSKFEKQERVDNAVYSNSSQKVEDTSDTTEPFSDPTSSGKLSNAGLPLKAPDQLIGVEADSFGTNDCLQLGVLESGILEDVVDSIPENTCQDAAIQEKENKLPSVSSVSEEATLGSISVERNELSSHPVSEVVNHDLSLQTEYLRNGDASSEVENVAYSAETGSSAKIIGEISLPEDTNESDALVVKKTGFDSIGSIADDKFPPEGNLLSVKPDGSTQPSDSMEGDVVVSAVSSETKMVVAEAVCPPKGSVATNSQEHITTTVEDHQNKADLSEPPSFIASANYGMEGEHHKVAPGSETVEVASHQPPKSDVKSFTASAHCGIEGEHHKVALATQTVEMASYQPPESDVKSFTASAPCGIEGGHHKVAPASETVEMESHQPPKSDVKSFTASAHCGIEGEHHKVAPASETVEVASDQPPKSDVKSFIGSGDCEMEGEQHKVAPVEVGSYEAPKCDGPQTGTLPCETEVIGSEGKQKNEEITGRKAVKHHSPLKNLLEEVKSPVALAKQQVGEKDGMSDAGFVEGPKATGNDAAAHKDIEEWNSPARYPIEIKKEKKKKGKYYWVPFVCCSSVHRDL